MLQQLQNSDLKIEKAAIDQSSLHFLKIATKPRKVQNVGKKWFARQLNKWNVKYVHCTLHKVLKTT